MSDFLERISKLSPKRLALLALELQSKVEALERSRAEPIAVIGLGCRFPGANNPDEFWQMLRDGVDAITEIPASRWDVSALYDPDPDAPGKVATRWGGFIAHPDLFEPQLFGIAPREALSMDPQQRVLLEVAWEALEDAGYAPDQLNGSPTGVFAGICNSDYAQMQLTDERDSLDMYFATGSAHSVAAGRVSYVLGLQGPSLAVDTACSSSLVAVHLAVQSLRNGECRMALAGGVNLILSSDTTVALSRAKMMASDGRCKAFDAAADGFVRSEGCGLVVLKRLSEALADGDRVLAVIRGSAINQDGRSNGLTAPNGPSQENVIRQALKDAGRQPGEVGYVETHGTGTSLGDPIEAQALGAVLGSGRASDRPLMIGSIKTNIGHAESAAGIAGLIKVILALQHQEIPPHLHLKELSPYISWDELPLTIPTTRTPWRDHRLAGVSSFGFSGTNAHLLVEEAPASTTKVIEAERPLHLLALSARTEQALHDLAQRYEQFLSASASVPLADIAHTANTGRAQFAHRLALTASDTGQAQTKLAKFVAGDESEVMRGLAFPKGDGRQRSGVVFLFTGQGSQYPGMGRQLYETQPTFRKAIDRCDELLRSQLDQSLISILYSENSALDETIYTQPALFAIEYALAELWQSWGVRPAAIMGHSVGEYAAACVAGVFSLEDGLKLLATRGRLMSEVRTLPRHGEMAAVFTSEARVAASLVPYAERVSIAVINGPEHIVISGDKVAVQSVLEALRAEGVKSRRLNISIAAHSPLMDSMLDEFEQAANSVQYSPPQVEFISGLTGQVIGSEIAAAHYWRRHVRESVRFSDAITTLHQSGYKCFLEIGPTPTLLPMAQRLLPAGDEAWLPSLRPGHDDWGQLLTSLGELYVHGLPVDWAGFDRDYAEARRRVALPTYPFQRERYWFTTPDDGSARQTLAVQRAERSPVVKAIHPLLGQRLHSPALEQIVFETQLSANWPTFLGHHRIYGEVILPSPAYMEMVLAGAAQAFGPGPYTLEDLTLREALLLPEDRLRTVQLVLAPAQADPVQFRVFSQDEEMNQWTLHATGKLRRGQNPSIQVSLSIDEIKARCPDEISGEAFYERVRELGLDFGENFRGLARLWRRDGEALGEIRLPEELTPELDGYGIHPALLDSCFHLLGAPLPDDGELSSYLLIGLERFQLYAKPGARLWSHTLLRSPNGAAKETFTGDIRLFDEQGQLVAEALGLQLKRASREALLSELRTTRKHPQFDDLRLYAVEWQPKPVQALLPADYLASPQHIAEHSQFQFDTLSAQHGLPVYQDFLPALNKLAAAYVLQALRQLGWAPRLGERVSTESLGARLGVVARHRRLFGRLLDMLLEEKNLRRVEGEWEVIDPSPLNLADPQVVLAALTASYPDSAELTLTARCGEHLAAVLRDQADPLQLLFPNGSLELTEKLYQDAPYARVYNVLVRQAVTTALASLPEGRRVRVLEIGAGSGATTSYLLSALPADRTEYTFTDISPLFLARAEEKFREYPFVRYQLLDIEHNPTAQGFAAHQFDMILAANVLHATSDLRQTLQHVRQLLAPQGLLILLEGTAPQRWVDITFGLTEGWWRFRDTDVRPAYPLLSRTAWLNLLKTLEFPDPVTIPEGGFEQALILARASARFAPERAFSLPTIQSTDEWLILADRSGVGQQLAELLRARGERAHLVRSGMAYVAGDGHTQINPKEPAHYRRLLNGRNYRGVVHLWSLDTSLPDQTNVASLVSDQALSSESVLHLTQALLRRSAGEHKQSNLWLVTRNAQPVKEQSEPLAVAQAPVWGLGRVIALEYPELWGGLIDLESNRAMPADALHVLTEISHSDGEDQTAWRDRERYVARLTHTALETTSVRWQPSAEGIYLITGGLGGLGLKVAHWLGERGARHILLIGRSALPDREQWADFAPGSDEHRKTAAIQAIESLGAAVTVVSADVADQTQMASLFARFGRDLPPLRGIFHAAVAMTAQTVDEMTVEMLAAMLRTKVIGTWVLHELTRPMALDCFILFSSTTSLWGSRALAHYAAANQFLDAFAHFRRALGLPALTINWGIWDEMRVASSEEKAKVAQFGLNPIPSEQALEVLGNLLGQPNLTQIAVAAVDWNALKPAYEARRQRPFLSQVNAQRRAAPNFGHPSGLETRLITSSQKSSAIQQPDLVRQLEATPAHERRSVLAAHIRAHVSKVLGLDPSQAIDEQQGLFEMGMDSLMSVELKSRLETSVGRSLPSTLTFNYPTIAALAEYLDGEVLLAAQVAELPSGLSQTNGEVHPAAPDQDDLSEDELADLLAEKLAQIK